MKITVEIMSCYDCRYDDHSGAFTEGGAKPICGHNVTCRMRGYNWEKRIRPEDGVIPKWCPLKDGHRY